MHSLVALQSIWLILMHSSATLDVVLPNHLALYTICMETMKGSSFIYAKRSIYYNLNLLLHYTKFLFAIFLHIVSNAAPHCILSANTKGARHMVIFLMRSNRTETGTFHVLLPYSHPISCIYGKLRSLKIKII